MAEEIGIDFIEVIDVIEHFKRLLNEGQVILDTKHIIIVVHVINNFSIWTVTNDEKKLKYSSPSQNLYSLEVKPLLILQRALGRFPYSFKKNGEFYFSWFSLPVFYSVAFYIGQTIWTCYSLEKLCNVNIANSSSYDEALFWTSITIFNIQNFLVPITYWIEAPKVVSYIKCWKEVQDESYSDGMNLVLKIPIRIFAVLILPMIVGLLLLQHYLLSSISILIFLPYLSSLGGVTTSLMLWCATLHEIRNISRQLMFKLLTHDFLEISAFCRFLQGNQAIQEGNEEISSKRIIWLRLSRLTTKLGDTMGETGLSTLAILFATFVPTAYGILAYFFDHSITSKSFWGLLLSAVFCLALKYCFCDAAHRTTDMVGESFSGKILKQDLSCLKQEHMNEVTLFLQTMTANPPNIQLHGFVTVNRGLFVSFISNTVTYLVVLLQFKASAVSMSAEKNSTTSFL